MLRLLTKEEQRKFVHDLLYEEFWGDDELKNDFKSDKPIELLLQKAAQGSYAALVPLYYAAECNAFPDEKTILLYECLLLQTIDYIQREDKYLIARARWQSANIIGTPCA